MPKIATDWNRNPSSQTSLYTYNSASIQFNEATRTFNGSLIPQPNESGKVASDWNKTAKTAADWNANPDFFTNQRLYDTTNLYDTTVTYDGVVAGESVLSTKNQTNWEYA